MMTSTEIRQAFLEFFKSKQHTIVPSAPIVIKDDPTLLFTNAGMNQFKDYFLGNKPAPWRRAADTQKCLRVSGKHNDLEEVGVDTYHHTMFEMLGNWSFGDPANLAAGYFKREAIAWSWEFLTEVLKMDKDRLYVTVFEGDEKEQLPQDEESINEWQKWIAPGRIVFGNKKDNFWEMGDTGPCGPCTEIHVDGRSDEERAQIDGKILINKDDPKVIEIWNNVFIQFNRLRDGSLQSLPARHVDTGMGFERLVRVLNNKTSNYDTDIFAGTIAETGKLSGRTYGRSSSKQDVAFRVIADHLRAICFTIADGQLPSNTGAGYVIRRILRRAVRYYYSYLDVKEPMMHKLVPGLAHQFEHVFPELFQQLDFVTRVVLEEENGFLRTLEGGLKRFDNYIKTEEGTGQKIISGSFAFELNDTYGFPIDLTELMAGELDWKVDRKGFDQELKQQRNRSRAATSIDAGDWTVLDKDAMNVFVGYDNLETESRVVKYRKVTSKGQEGWQMVLESTPFYAESGGQVGDTGTLSFEDEVISVLNTKKDYELVIHFIDKLPSKPSAPVFAKVDRNKRKSTAVHHSATHLLHAALRKVLGTHVAQKGSLVNADYLRFDFSHFSKLTDHEISEIESIVNEKIRENIPVITRELPKEEALKLGAMALFGEKYGDRVRVVIIDSAYSVELCGGTHVGQTGELGFFKIRQESAVASGVRRLEAVSGLAAELLIHESMHELHHSKLLLKNPKDFARSIEQLQQENSDLKKQLEKLEAKHAGTTGKELLESTTLINGTTFIGKVIEAGNGDALKKICLELKNELVAPYAIVLCANISGKAAVAVMYDDESANSGKRDAGKTIKETVAPLIRGGGGGSRALATAGGQDVSAFETVIQQVKSLL